MSALLDKSLRPYPDVANGTKIPWVVDLFPAQGEWSFDDYLAVELRTNVRMELVDGRLEVLASPTRTHEKVAHAHKMSLIAAVIETKLGDVLGPAYTVRIGDGSGRQPDVVVILREHFSWMHDDSADCADLVVEVVSHSRSDRNRDLVDKPTEYAAAGIREYHIDDLEHRTVTVLTLRDGAYVEHGVFRDGETVTSPLLPGWTMDVTACLDAGKIG